MQIGVSFTGHLKAVRQTGDRLQEESIAPSTALITTGAPVTWLRVTEPSECVEIFPEPRSVSEASNGRIESLDAICVGDFVEDPIIASIATLARKAALASTQVGDLEGDALIHRLLEHVVFSYSGFRRPDDRAVRGGISVRTMRVLTDYVESHLAERITLAQLAALAALSPFHFSRAFKVTSGCTPHEFVTARRMERAKCLIATTSLSIDRIAARVGFRNLGHFRRKFREHHGTRPIDVRRSYNPTP